MQKARSKDPGLILANFLQHIWVECPKCSNPALSSINDTVPTSPKRSLSCTNCGYYVGDTKSHTSISDAVSLSAWKPRCKKCGAALRHMTHLHPFRQNGRLLAQARCPVCRFTGTYPAIGSNLTARLQEGRDPDFGLPLYLTTTIGNNLFWAVNTGHLYFLEEWLTAELRERSEFGRMTMIARLPRWMKIASNRPKVLKAIVELQTKARKGRIP